MYELVNYMFPSFSKWQIQGLPNLRLTNHPQWLAVETPHCLDMEIPQAPSETSGPMYLQSLRHAAQRGRTSESL